MSFFRQSPAANSDAELLFGRFVAKAAKQGRWVGYDTGWTLSQLAEFEAGRKSGTLNHFGRGLAAAVDQVLVKLEVAGEKVYILPTEILVKLTQDRVTEYSKPT